MNSSELKVFDEKQDNELIYKIINLLKEEKCTLSKFDRVSDKVHEYYLKNALIKN